MKFYSLENLEEIKSCATMFKVSGIFRQHQYSSRSVWLPVFSGDAKIGEKMIFNFNTFFLYIVIIFIF